MRIFLSLVFVVVGILITMKANWIVENFGTLPWAEKHLGSTSLYWKLFGITVTTVSILTMIGVTQAVLVSIFGRFAPRVQTQ